MKLLDELKKRDVFVTLFANAAYTFIVKANDIHTKTIVATAPTWFKNDVEMFSYVEIERRGWAYLKKYSRLRWFLKL